MAARIIEYRQKNGGFKKVEELMNIRGIGEKAFLKLKPLVTVTPPKTIER
jgi:competence protein ComEA